MAAYLLAAYAASWLAIAVFSFHPVRGPKEPGKAWVIVATLPLLMLGGLIRSLIDWNGAAGGILIGIALNVSILLGTKFDPLTAVVHWDDDEADGETGTTGDEVGADHCDVRERRAWPSLLIFTVLAIALVVGLPEIYKFD